MHDFFNVLGLALIPAVMFLAYEVVRHYIPKLRGKRAADYGAQDFLMLGIVTGFAVTATVNVAFWGLHFLATLLHWRSAQDFTWRWGQAANVFTRYVPYIIAAGLHLYAGFKAEIPGVLHPRFYAITTVALTSVAFIALELVRP